MPLQSIMEVKAFDCWGIDFIGPFLSSYSYEYILLAVDYVTKWVEAVAVQHANAKIVIHFLKKNIFLRFGTPRVLITDRGSHFCNAQLTKVQHYNIKHNGIRQPHRARPLPQRRRRRRQRLLPRGRTGQRARRAPAARPPSSARSSCVCAKVRIDASIGQQPGYPAARRTRPTVRGAGHQHNPTHKGTHQRPQRLVRRDCHQ